MNKALSSKTKFICLGYVIFFLFSCSDQGDYREANLSLIQGPGSISGAREEGLLGGGLSSCQISSEETIISKLKVINNTTGSQFDFLPSDTLTLSFEATTKRGLAAKPLSRIEVSTAADEWTNYPSLTNFPIGDRTDLNNFKWSASLPVPTDRVFQIKVSVEDQCGSIVTAVSEALNSSNWKIFAGRTDLPENESVRNALLAPTNDGCSGCLEILDNNDVLFIDQEIGIRLIDGKTGNIRTVIKGPGLVTARSAMAKFGNFIYLTHPDGIFALIPSLTSQLCSSMPGVEVYLAALFLLLANLKS